jgi:putative ABC transport system permease protein
VRALPGVKSVAAVGTIPLFKGGSPQNLFLQDERPLLDRPSYPLDRHTVTPGALEVLGIPLLRGRDFTEYDTQRSPRVVIINKTLADRFFPNEDPIGMQIMTHSASWPLKGWVGLEIIGVVGDVRHYDLSAEVSPEVYGSCLQNPIRYWSRPTLVIRTIGEPLGLVDTLRDAVEGEKLRGKILINIGTLEGILDDSVATEKFSALLLTLFAGVALVLASGGIYGVMSYSTTQRTQELAVRMALGAQPRHVLLLILGEGLTLALIGVVLGLTGCLAGTRVLASLLYGIEPTDPATYVVLATLLVGVALLACYLPARRAMRIDPMAALRYA